MPYKLNSKREFAGKTQDKVLFNNIGIKTVFIVGLVLNICISCTDKNKFENAYKDGKFEKAITLFYETELSNNKDDEEINTILYHCYKNILDEIFAWSGPVVILDSSYFENRQIDYIQNFEILLQQWNKKGMLGGIKFRMGKFDDAFELYRSIYDTREDESVSNDLKASLAGIILGADFQFSDNSDLYYKADKVLSSINIDKLSSDVKRYIELYYETTNNIQIISALVNNDITLNRLVKEYNLTKENIKELYNAAIQNGNIASAEILSHKLDKQYAKFTAFFKICEAYHEKEYDTALKMINKFNAEYQNIEKDWIDLLNLIVFYAKIQSNNLSNIIDIYVELEKNFLSEEIYDLEEDNYYLRYDNNEIIDNNDETDKFREIMLERNKYLNLRNEKDVCRNIMESLIRENSSIEQQVKKYIHKNLDVDIKTIFYEMLLKKALFYNDHESSYGLCNKMINNLLFGITIPENTFFKIYDILEIIHYANNQNQLKILRDKTIARIKIETEQLINNHNTFNKSNTKRYIEAINTQINSNINELYSYVHMKNYKNIFYILTDQKDSYINTLLFYRNLATKLNKSTTIFSSKLNLNKNNIDKDDIYSFFQYESSKNFSELHYEIIKLNIILESIFEKCDKDYLFLYYATFFPNIIFQYGSLNLYKTNEQNKNLVILKSMNNIKVGSKDENQIIYYQLLKNKFRQLQKKQTNYQIQIK
jgi:hypothetical protein